MASFVDRVVRTARLDVAAFEEVEADGGATAQAMGVVLLSSVAGGIGMGRGAGTLVGIIIASLVGWYLWALLVYLIGTRWLPEPGTSATHGELLRTVGFASGPGIIRVLGVVPVLRGLVFLAAAVWMLVAGIIAVRQALDYRSTWRAVGVVAIGWAVQWLVVALVVGIMRQAH